jgi:hypothetical protein
MRSISLKLRERQRFGARGILFRRSRAVTGARHTVFNQFFTSPSVIQAMHHALYRLGVPANATVPEPACRTGNFMAYAPPDMHFIGVELDSISARIARALHAEQDKHANGWSQEMELRALIEAVKMADGPCTVISDHEGIVKRAKQRNTPEFCKPVWEELYASMGART